MPAKTPTTVAHGGAGFRCRFIPGGPCSPNIAIGRAAASGIEIAAVINPRDFDGKRGFSPAQGQ